MKRQKYPAGKIKVGLVLYQFNAYTDDETGKSSVECYEWVVRSIMKKRGSQSQYGVKKSTAEFWQQRYVHITQKIDGLTWGKKSRKNGDFGWLSSIPAWARDSFTEGEDLPDGIYTTKLAALKSAINSKVDDIARYKQWNLKEDDHEYWTSSIQEAEVELRLLKSRLTRMQNASQKEKAA